MSAANAFQEGYDFCAVYGFNGFYDFYDFYGFNVFNVFPTSDL